MKNPFLFTLGFIFLSLSLLAQQEEGNPFARLGYKTSIATFGNNKEFHDQLDIVEIGSVLFDTRTDEVIGFVEDNDPYSRGVIPGIQSMCIDPKSEKYCAITPYGYCINNPIRVTDPDGEDIYIHGELNWMALFQLQSILGNAGFLQMGGNGLLSYTLNDDIELTGQAKMIIDMIDNHSTILNIITIDGKFTPSGNLFVGGAFMGNKVSEDKDGKIIVEANQVINPKVLGTADMHTRTPGSLTMHEVTEAYQGALISQENQLSSGNSSISKDIYLEAHGKATPQTRVDIFMYDINGRKTKNIKKAVKVEWVVKNKQGEKKVIQTLP